MPGSYAANLHQASRSEILAQYLFSAWGTVTPVRQQDDHGLDLYCTLAERARRSAWVRESYTVQVKSDGVDWSFKDRDEVRWLMEHPSPLLLCTVNQKTGRIRLYHTMPRFVLDKSKLPDSLLLRPGEGRNGGFVPWGNSSEFDLGAPIIEVAGAEVFDSELLDRLAAILATWLRYERVNLGLLQNGLTRFRMPERYVTNEDPTEGIVEQSGILLDDAKIGPAVVALCEALDYVGSQLHIRREQTGAILASLLVRWLQVRFKPTFAGNRLIEGARSLSFIMNRLNNAAKGTGFYGGVDELLRQLEQNPLVVEVNKEPPPE